jgi:hypothetical protein
MNFINFEKKEWIAIGVFVLGTVLASLFLGLSGLGFIGGPLGVGVFLYIWLNRKDLTDGIKTGLVNLFGMARDQFEGMRRRGRTPGGAEVNASRATGSIPSYVLKNIDIGVRNGVKRVTLAHPDWKNKTQISDYAFVFVNPMGVSIDTPGAPTFTVNNFGSPSVIASGAIMGLQANTGPKRPYIVLPHQAGSSWKYSQYLVNTVLHEVIHYMEAFNGDGSDFHRHEGVDHKDFDVEYLPAPGEEAAISA